MGRRGIVATFVVFSAIGMLWAVAMPINAGPDEDQHLIWAASTARWQLEPTGPEGDQRLAAPEVLYVERCFQFRPASVTAACQEGERSDPGSDVRTVSRSQWPVYHWIVGLPSLLTTQFRSAYLMRMAHVVLTAAFLTLGVVSFSRLPLSPGSIAFATVACTPMVVFLMSVVNPSGPTVAAGFALWTGGVAVGRTRPHSGAHVLAGVVVPLVAMMILRRDSLLWALLIIVVLAVEAGGRRLTELVHLRMVRVTLTVVVLAASAVVLLRGADSAQGFFVGGESSRYPPASYAKSFGRIPYDLEQMIGVLGWLDVRLPSPVVLVWSGLVIAAVLIGVGASRRAGLAIAVLGTLLVMVPLFLNTQRFAYYQGRYGLPLAIGLPLLAAVALARPQSAHHVNARMAKVVVWTVAALQTVAFATALRRFSVTTDAPWAEMVVDPVWSPPLPIPVLLVGHVFLVGGLAVWIGRAADRSELAVVSGS